MPLVTPLLALWLLGAEARPAAVVLVTRRTAVTPAQANALAAECWEGLRAGGVPLALEPAATLKQLARVSVKDSASCNGRRACVAELGRQLKADYVVALSVSRLDADTSVALELVRVADEGVVEKDSLLLSKKAALDVAGFAAKVKAVLLPEAPPPPPEEEKPRPAPDAPTEAKLVPRDVQPPPAVPPPEPPRTHAASFVLGGVGVAALAAGAVLLGVGLSQRTALEQGAPGPDGRARSPLTGAQAAAMNGSSSALLGVSVGALAAGVGLGTAAVFTW